MTRAVGRVQDLIVEDREVEGKSEADRMGRGELSLSDVRGVLHEGITVQLVGFPIPKNVINSGILTL